ncbi:MAG: DUF2344 domain-containing protein, partial [Cyanobacteria bacterium Co-bin13]|nr:DUF2344 domain-containing protein [Cyanobacteria bacterium Co-bin13]
RQVEQGEWNLFGERHSQTSEAGSQEGADPATALSAPDPVPPVSPAPQPSYDSPLPWDHLDTGIDKRWLQEDLIRALAAATVPDCSFEGCSHCGVCGPDFGHNVVVPPPAIPAFEGHFQPSQERVQRLRVRLGKLGEMAYLGHLDLVRLLDRAIRRAALPITFTGGFHPTPRISPANALPLGATSSGEVIDFELKAWVEPEEFGRRLAAQLPADVPVLGVESVPLESPSATKVLEKAEYCLTVGLAEESVTPADWTGWIAALQGLPEIWWEHKTKSGKLQQVNLCDRIHHLSLVAPEALADLPQQSQPEAGQQVVRYVGSCRNDGTLLRPEQVVYMLEHVAQVQLQLHHIHRSQLLLTGVEPQVQLGAGPLDEG